jgi:D-glycerate 3-kinase
VDGPPSTLAAQLGAWLEEQAESLGKRPLVVGIHGPQGSGKSTLAAHLVSSLAARGARGATVSVDDLYLTHAEQRELAEAHAGNPYLEHRGYPGTHDLGLGERVIAALRSDRPGEVAVPSYDKSAHGGRGDRRPEREWPQVSTPLDLLFLEGWMVAFRPVPEGRVPDPRLLVPNTCLGGYQRWQRHLDAWIVLEVSDRDLGHILGWRVDAERARRAAGQAGLSDAQALEYVTRFLPAYRLWAPSPQGPCVTVELGPDRGVLRVAARRGLL